MNIYFFLNTEEETPITTCETESNPFNLGGEIMLEPMELYEAELIQFRYNPKERQMVINENEVLRRTFLHRTIKLVGVHKIIRFNNLTEPVITIEYHCDLIN